MIDNETDDYYTSWLRKCARRSKLRRYITKVLPAHLLREIVFESHMLFLRMWSWHASRVYRRKTDLLVNIGAGKSGKSGWVNLDGFANHGVNCRYDARKHLPFSDNSVRGIFTEHFLEHIDYTEDVPIFLGECYRVLMDGGVIRIIVPDAEKYLNAYVRGSWQELASIRPLDDKMRDYYFKFKYNTRMELINVVFRQGGEHKFAYDFETIELILNISGFVEIKRQEFRKSVFQDMCIDLAERASESLYVEAVKRIV